MDIARPSNARRKRMRQIAFATAGLIVVSLVSYVLANLEPAAPIVEAGTVWDDTVKRGPMVREVRGLGTLVPEDIRWIPATTQGRVERIVLRPGTPVKPDSVILELSNPQLDQELRNAELQLQSAEASLVNLQVQVQNDLLSQRASAASIEADFNRAKMQVQMNEALAKDQLVSELILKQSQLDAQQLSVASSNRSGAAREPCRLGPRADGRPAGGRRPGACDGRPPPSPARRAEGPRRHRRRAAGDSCGDSGRHSGRARAPTWRGSPTRARLMAEIKIAETQARDIQIDQTRRDRHAHWLHPRSRRPHRSVVQNGTRTVDVSLDGELPRGAVPDLSVDGKIVLERLDDVLYVGRPAFGAGSGGGHALQDVSRRDRRRARAGEAREDLGEHRRSVEGLAVGDKVILSDMSAWDAFDRVRLR